jgi:hypothetical protein
MIDIENINVGKVRICYRLQVIYSSAIAYL